MPARGQRRPATPIGDPTDPAGMGRAVADYLAWLEVHHFARATIMDRTKCLKLLVAWLAERGITRPDQVTKPILEAYQRHLFWRRKPDGTPLSAQTQAGYLSAARVLFRFLARDNRVLYNPAADLVMPRFERRLPRTILTAVEVEEVLAMPDLATPVGLRDRAILEVLYSTGMRRQELLNLGVADIDAERGVVLIRLGKGGRDRVVPIGARSVAWVDRYLLEARPKLVVLPDDGLLFVTTDGTEFTPGRLSDLVTAYVERSAVPKHGSCHMIRHTCATLMLEGGADVRYVQELLGHANLTSTQIYTHVSIRALKAVHDLCHPAATNSSHRAPNRPSPPDTTESDTTPAGTGRDMDGEGSAAGLMAALDAEQAEEDDNHDQPDRGHDRRDRAG
jgi:integrase/recombinase XerD